MCIFQPCECSREQPEAFPREEEERFEATQPLFRPHHSQVCVVTQPQRITLAFPKRHLRHKGRDEHALYSLTLCSSAVFRGRIKVCCRFLGHRRNTDDKPERQSNSQSQAELGVELVTDCHHP